MFMIVFGIHCNFFIVLRYRLKTYRSNDFSCFQGKSARPKSRARLRGFSRQFFQAWITRLKAIWMQKFQYVFNTVAVARTTMILLQCLSQGVMCIQLQEKSEKNLHHQQYKQEHHLMVIVRQKVLM